MTKRADMYDEPLVMRQFMAAPDIIKAAVRAILDFEDVIDPIGYDLAYYIEDLPRVVAEAIEPWKQYG